MILQNSIRTNFSKRFLYLLVVSFISMYSYAQQNSEMEKWLTTITKKHEIKCDSFTVIDNYFIIGDKMIKGELETFKNVTILTKEKDYYFIYRSENASYDPKNKILKMDDCSMERYKNDSDSLIPEHKFDNRSFKHDIKINRVWIGPVKNKAEK